MTTPLAIAVAVFLGALVWLGVWFYRRAASEENTDNWLTTEATIQSVGKAIGEGKNSCPVDVGDFSYVVDGEYYSGRATISRAFSAGDGRPKDLVNRNFQLRYDPRKPDKFDLSVADVDGFMLYPYDDFLMQDIGMTDIFDN